jgi:serine/threonine-protein kinase
MAEVFKARAVGCAGFVRDVVIKRILPGHGRDPDFVRMFVDEAKILGMLHHPNVAQAYDFGEEDGMLYLALEYVEGPSLSRVLRTLRSSNRKMSPAIVAYVAREICRALDYVHNLENDDGVPLRVIHRDVTPSNVMLTPAGCVKLLDFGVAKFVAAAQATKTGTVKGKPAYLAPEQLEGKSIDGRVDLFALGIVMHEMLSLEHLFAGDSDLGTAKKIAEMEIPLPSCKRHDIPPEVDRIVMKALERDLARRYASAAEMARDLDDFVIGSRLRIDEVAAFVREIEAEASARVTRSRAAAAAEDSADPTRRDLGLVVRMWTMGRWFGRPRAAVLAAAALVALGLATALGMHMSSAPHKQSRAEVRGVATPGPSAAAAAVTGSEAR